MTRREKAGDVVLAAAIVAVWVAIAAVLFWVLP